VVWQNRFGTKIGKNVEEETVIETKTKCWDLEIRKPPVGGFKNL